MKIAVLGAGHIGKTLARRFAAAGHEVRMTNSRGPETLKELADEIGAAALVGTEAVHDADVVITSVPFARIPDLRPIVDLAPDRAVVIDTSNYYAHRDDTIESVEAGQVESEWVVEQLGRPIVKAWNSILEGSLATRCYGPGHPERTALPVAGDDAAAKYIAMYLVELTGFDAVDAGSIAESWRQQPGAPAYTTELPAAELPAALDRADRSTLVAKRARIVAEGSKLPGWGTNDDRLRIARETCL